MQEKNIIEQQKKDFLSTLSTFSHEIRNPLALITGEMQMLSDSHPQLCFDEHWDNIMDNLNYIREILDELSRYQNAGRLSLVPVDAGICLQHIAASFRPALDYLGITLETDIPLDLPQVPLDQTKIRQALFNLLRNAQESIQHSHGKIQISASAVSDGIRLVIRDNGCGMTAQQMEHVFHPFVTYKPGGTGLGLAVTRQIIEAHHGTLDVQSTVDEGTTFYIFLPCDG
ncbi:sensor histidine kinase [Blautia sp. MSJ-19]|uniref:sensor histidine kinase n=1 Tax=Blautia sp. MSJ-19 TaxID=2841517 RepID=UPI001C0EC44F|nr:HAMP domain-containing sensor histidine kinase [Blautia sp. MSJ-19]MBU5482451.1 HAMP domain-containing histidine kinase [Blautia sp. MSJ-19]